MNPLLTIAQRLRELDANQHKSWHDGACELYNLTSLFAAAMEELENARAIEVACPFAAFLDPPGHGKRLEYDTLLNARRDLRERTDTELSKVKLP